jgi:GntR family histidine utilization transcriptional repressor
MARIWQDIHAEALRRIQTREWPPGALIPNEEALAAELGCARATVNRALRALADAGLLERRRKAGTRVAVSPQRHAQLAIPLIRQEIESRGQTFSHTILDRSPGPMPALQRAGLGLPETAPVERVRTLYLADGHPFAVEDRWVHLAAVPGFERAALDRISPNEWLVRNAPFAHGTLEYGADAASADSARYLGCAPETPVMTLERRTFGPNAPVTWVRLTYAPGHRLRLNI